MNRKKKLMTVEIWSDVVCPWCYIGKRRFESALGRFENREAVEVIWRSFQLDPSAPATGGEPVAAMLARKYGVSLDRAIAMNDHVTRTAAGDGLEYHLKSARVANTFDAHRLIHLAAHYGMQGVMKERLLRAYFTEGLAIGEHATLQRLAEEVGLPREEVRAMLASDLLADSVRADFARGEGFGIRGVPFFVIDERYGVSGAQPAGVLLEALEEAWSKRQPLETIGGVADACADGSCEIPAP
jgi:predicted DsbA family dithiol-disulfide isomerase